MPLDLDTFPADTIALGVLTGLSLWFVLKYVIFGFYTVDQNERAVVLTFGRAKRALGATTPYTPEGAPMRASERERYAYPQLEVVKPGGPYFRWPWQRVVKTSIAIQTVNMAWDPDDPGANYDGTQLEAVTKDQLNVGLRGQIRYRVHEGNLYAYLFGVKRPIAHVMGFFVSILRERIARFEAPVREGDVIAAGVSGVSINDLRKNLRSLNEHMDQECAASTARYGILLEASLITEIDPPVEIESALAAINTAHNLVSSDVSLAQAAADQRIVQSRRAVEISTLEANAEVEPLLALAAELETLKASGAGALDAYERNVRLALYGRAERILAEVAR